MKQSKLHATFFNKKTLSLILYIDTCSLVTFPVGKLAFLFAVVGNFAPRTFTEPLG